MATLLSRHSRFSKEARASFDIVVKTADKTELRHTLNVDVTGHYFFGVAIAA